MDRLVEDFIRATNAFDTEAAMALFAEDAVIDDISVGGQFAGKTRIRDYLETYFVGYRTVTKLLLLEPIDDRQVIAHVDFTGNFGHETGQLRLCVNAHGLIERIDADLN